MRTPFFLAAVLSLISISPATAATFTIVVDGSDSIFLAGRTDYSIPAANLPWADGSAATDDGLLRHSGNTPEEILETLPPFISVTAGDVIRVVDPADGGISFFNGLGAPFYGPEGNGVAGISQLTSLGGLSGWKATQGALAGVFLSDTVPSLANGAPPATLDFSASGLGLDFTSLTPELRQVFFIGDGQTSGGVLQEFVAPVGATRLFFGVPDGFGFNGVPGAYDDNDGAYRIRVGINETPTIPLPAGGLLLGSALMLLGLRRRIKN